MLYAVLLFFAATPEFSTVPKYREVPPKNGQIYSDVMSHAERVDSGNSRSTVVHETSHFISESVRNEYMRSHEGHFNAFYVLEGRCVILREPNVRISQARQFIPESLRGVYYQTYMVNAMSWDDRPLYIFDEWNAYILGGKNAVEDVKAGRHDDTVQRVTPSMEFTFYSLAICQAIKKYDPKRWESDDNLKAFVRYQAEISFELCRTGKEQFPDESMDRMMKAFLNNPECQELRDVAKEVGLPIQ